MEAAIFGGRSAYASAPWERYDPIVTCFCDAPYFCKSVSVYFPGLLRTIAPERTIKRGLLSQVPLFRFPALAS